MVVDAGGRLKAGLAANRVDAIRVDSANERVLWI